MTLNQQPAHKPTQKHLSPDLFDVLVAGAGVVGCAMARRFTLAGARVAVVEKASDILDGASKANSAILHTGFDAPAGSLELSCIRAGYHEYRQIHADMGLPMDRCAAHVVAWSDQQEQQLEALADHARANAIDDVSLISASQLHKREPHLSDTARAALAIPGEAIIDPWSAPYAFLHQALANGAEVFLDCELAGGRFDGGHWHLETSRGALRASHVINCAGLYGDLLDKAVLGSSRFAIKPRKGQFVVFDKAASTLVNSIILPVPSKNTKGVVLCRTVFGNVLAGPTAQDQDSRSDTATSKPELAGLIATAAQKIPALAHMPVTAAYAGLRPASARKDYQITCEPDRNWITVGAIRSTGLTGALGIARHVLKLYEDQGNARRPLPRPAAARAATLAQAGERDWQRPGHGQIICHCELVSEREISKALTGPLAARSLGGLKRQTRVTMGRCQGFYCSARLAEMTGDHFAPPLAAKIAHD